jgi:hydroxymethylpyrimidine/phosphomethylpyrimidine kinase
LGIFRADYSKTALPGAGFARTLPLMQAPPPVALTIAGSDCSAGAGIQADLKTFQHFGVHGLTSVTCIVSETANVVRAVHPVPPEIVADQTALLLESFPIAAIKTGMLFSAAHIDAVKATLARHPGIPLVIDPVMIASTGTALIDPDAIAALEALLPLAALVTPNLPEAEAFAGESITDAEAVERVGQRLSERFGVPFLLKGGHLDGPNCTDLLIAHGKTHRFSSERFDLPGSHGTGCTFSAAIAANLALGHDLAEAVGRAKLYLIRTLADSYVFEAPGREPVHALNQGTAF